MKKVLGKPWPGASRTDRDHRGPRDRFESCGWWPFGKESPVAYCSACGCCVLMLVMVTLAIFAFATSPSCASCNCATTNDTKAYDAIQDFKMIANILDEYNAVNARHQAKNPLAWKRMMTRLGMEI